MKGCVNKTLALSFETLVDWVELPLYRCYRINTSASTTNLYEKNHHSVSQQHLQRDRGSINAKVGIGSSWTLENYGSQGLICQIGHINCNGAKQCNAVIANPNQPLVKVLGQTPTHP